MQFGVLGPLSVWTDDGLPVKVPEAKVRALLADLLIHLGTPVSADRLADDLWGDALPGNPGNTLQTKVSQLRRAIGRDLVSFEPTGYLLHTTSVDSLRFAALLERARSAVDLRVRAGLLSDALGLWRGPAYEDFASWGFALATAARLDEQRLTAVEELAEVRLALGEHSSLADELGELVASYPLRERLAGAHLLALYRSGRQTEALAGYGRLRTALAEELGLDPGPALAALHQAMLVQDPSLVLVAAPATSAARPATNLPAQLTDLVGRDSAVSSVRSLVESSRLVTLTGPGGVGKTRLALASADLPFPDGVWLVELAGVGSGELVDVVAATLGVRDETALGARPGVPVEGLAWRLADALRDQRLLLVLDNCEHLVEPVAELAGLLLRAAPGLRILATSQESLAIPGETVYPVDPLVQPDAVRLFVARAGITLDAGNTPWVDAICRRLDGLPLALELAAARVRALGVRGVAERLDDRFHLLAGASRGLPPRQRTLRAVIDWSWEQLSPEQRDAMRELATHPGGCTAEAVDVPVEVLIQLVNRSMVVAEGDPSRFRLLESIAAYALESASPAAFDRRDAYYTALAERAVPFLYGRAQREWLDRLDAETLNLRAALDRMADPSRLANALAWYWYLRGRHTEAYRWLSGGQNAWAAGFRILTGAGNSDFAPFDARSRWFLALAHLHFGDVSAAKGLLESALGGFRSLGDRWGEAAALACRTKQALFEGDFALAESAGALSLEIFTELGDRWGQLQASDQLGWLAEINGDYARAGRLHRDGLRVAEDLRLWTDVSYRLSSLGRIALLNGDLAGSREFHERGMRLGASQSNRFAEEFARVGLGLVARRAGDLAAAESLFMESLSWNRALERDYGIPFYGVTLILAELGFVAEQRGDAAVARTRHLEGLAAAEEIGDPRAIALAKEGLAGVAALEGSYEEARRLLTEASALRESVGAPLPPAERTDVNRILAAIS
ncbi:BTAD domain-containing putative transcriptional regulator [Nonomuraea sp. NPDC050556]|uniref:BTAD domain-containing putative transcriptional regulator n=1 Tax=Nonomuraea sp. NPDC050556 TaxID=3364369 RepID=UPI003789905C